METGILKQVDLQTAIAQYFYVEADHHANWIKVSSTQPFKPFELTLRMSDLQIEHDSAVAATKHKKYEFNDNTGGLITLFENWQRTLIA
ncbi:hypothetical protein RA086_01215 [Lactiplantibacillus sp. WILCCON 0030]|uniref:Uncharacterized protein n=1 Tax=Lactiplantibacillus brownii TaxID=3069269 RepID=A0ABU1A6F7_9LACO|nr:hypothetical protein [Lactiplantibacillus brownii]MDQ7936270.1 hypothetical protein [Lactiplantibacillus brownii]